MHEVLAERGYLIWATVQPDVDYLDCAVACATSIRLHTPDAKIALVTDDEDFQHPVFDYVIEFPLGIAVNKPALHNDWQVFYATPFRETIKIEADMIIPHSIDHWWTMLRNRDVVLTIGARNACNLPTPERYYRRIFDENNLPDVYNAITYWRRSMLAIQFSQLVATLFTNWDTVKKGLKFGELDPDGSTDVVYAIAAKMLGVENFVLPGTSYPTLIHMKGHINNLETEDWTKEMMYELDGPNIRVNTIDQAYPFHYVTKEFSKVLNEHYQQLL